MKRRNPTSLRNKKGFTIVELIIVIAVIGILAAILIPTFASIINKANVSSDVSACKNMNTTLAEARTENNNQIDYSTAKDALKNAGYSISKLKVMGENGSYYFVPSLGMIVYFDEAENKVVYPTEYKDLVKDSTWVKLEKSFAQQATATGMALDFDLILTDDAEVVLDGNENYTFDLAGKTLDMAGHSLIIEGSTTGTVTFTGGTLTNGTVLVNVPNGDIEYAAISTSSVNWRVVAVKDGTFHMIQNSKINGTLVILQGKIEVTNSAFVAVLKVTEDVKADIHVVVEQGGNISAMRVAETATTHVTATVAENSVQYVSSNMTEVVASGATAVTITDTGALVKDFFGGKGTQAEPYIITSPEEFNTIYDALKAEEEATMLYFNLASDIDFTGKTIDNYPMHDAYSYLFFDGGNHEIKGVAKFTDEYDYALFQYLKNSTVQNVNVTFAGDGSLAYGAFGDVLIKNVKTNGFIDASSGGWWAAAPFMIYPAGEAGHETNLVFDTCESNVQIIGDANYAAGFIVHAQSVNMTSLKFKNCSVGAKINGKNASAFCGMVTTSKVTLEGTNTVTGKLIGTTGAGLLLPSSALQTEYPGITKASSAVIARMANFTTVAPQNMGDAIVVPAQAGAAKYVVAVSYSVHAYNFPGVGTVWAGSFPRVISEKYDAPASGDLTTNLKKLYVAEGNKAMHDYQTDAEVDYTGIYAPNGFLYDLTKKISSYGGKEFYFYNEPEGYHGLLTSAQQADVNAAVTVSVSISVYDDDNVMFTASSFNYSYTVANARTYLGGN